MNHPKLLKLIKLVLTAVAVFYVGLIGFLFFFQERLIFKPKQTAADFKFQFRHPFEERYLEVGGLKVHSILFRAPEPRGVILYFHGNSATLATWGGTAEDLIDRGGWSVWMIDYPGYGKSEGAITSEEQLHEVSEALWQAAITEFGEAMPKILYGRSIGTGLAAHLASKHKTAGLVLESPYFSLQQLADEQYPYVPSFVMRYTLRTDEWVAKTNSPILIFHGDEDKTIPFHHAQQLVAMAPGARLIEVKTAGHNNLAKFAQYWENLTKFLKRN